jgi:hypothetical protein
MGQNRLRLIYLHATGGGEKHEAYTSTSVRTVGGRVASCVSPGHQKIRLLYDRGVGF